MRRRVAKHFEENKLYFGTVTTYDEKGSYFRINYDDGDFEDVTYEELLSMLKLYEGEKRKDAKVKKRRIQINTVEKEEVSVKRRSRSGGNAAGKAPLNEDLAVLDNRLEMIESQLNARIEKVSQLEKRFFGVSRDGPLQERVKRLEELLCGDLST